MKAAADRAFVALVAALTVLAALPLWLTRILPMQDYPQILVLARAYGAASDPASPFFGTYTTGFPLAPLALPILLLRALGAAFGLETAGRLAWTAYMIALPLCALRLLRALRHDRWAVLLVFPIALSSWVSGGFFAFATAAPLVVLGVALSVEWLETPSRRRGAALAALLVALHLWHALAFAELLFDFGVLWLLVRMDDVRARLSALAPLAPSLALFAAWALTTVVGHAAGAQPAVWVALRDKATGFFAYVVPEVPIATGVAIALAVVLLASAAGGAVARARGLRPANVETAATAAFRVENPALWLALGALALYAALPESCLGVQGIDNRHPWYAALFAVVAWRPPRRAVVARALVAAAVVASAVVSLDFARRFTAFDRESGGASRLVDRLAPGQTLLAPTRGGLSTSMPGRPLVAIEQYASIRGGGLPSSSFAGYGLNLVRYVGGMNPMPGLIVGWLESPALTRYDAVLLRGPNPAVAKRGDRLREIAKDGEWTLYAVCGSKARPSCP
ncbi:MAG TPA: hypothetical protein VGM56_26835 [Byssovorax sp.]|jgi:hypothetical protein